MAGGAFLAGLLFACPTDAAVFTLPSSSEDEEEADEEDEDDEELSLSPSVSLLSSLLLPLLPLLSLFFCPTFTFSSSFSFLGGLLAFSWPWFIPGLLSFSKGLELPLLQSADVRRSSLCLLPSGTRSLCSLSWLLMLSFSLLLPSASLWDTGKEEMGDLESLFRTSLGWKGEPLLSILLSVSFLSFDTLACRSLSVPCSLSVLRPLLNLSTRGGDGDEESCLLFVGCFFRSLSNSASLFLFLSCFGCGEVDEAEEESCLALWGRPFLWSLFSLLLERLPLSTSLLLERLFTFSLLLERLSRTFSVSLLLDRLPFCNSLLLEALPFTLSLTLLPFSLSFSMLLERLPFSISLLFSFSLLLDLLSLILCACGGGDGDEESCRFLAEVFSACLSTLDFFCTAKKTMLCIHSQELLVQAAFQPYPISFPIMWAVLLIGPPSSVCWSPLSTIIASFGTFVLLTSSDWRWRPAVWHPKTRPDTET